MVLTQVDELVDTGNASTGVFQMLSAGKTGQFPITGPCANAHPVAITKRANRSKFVLLQFEVELTYHIYYYFSSWLYQAAKIRRITASVN
jgi:hypothetical protein